MNINKKQELERRTIKILESTKNHINKYSNERNILYNYFKDGKDLIEWEEFLNNFETEIDI